MKKLVLMAVLTCLAAFLVIPAGALEYTIAPPNDYLFGEATSDSTVYEWENPNVDRSKDASLIPPGFGTPASYQPYSGETLMSGTVADAGNDIVIGGTVTYPTVNAAVQQVPAFTQVTRDFYFANGSLGTIQIPSIGLTVGIYEGTTSAALAKGAGHFEGTSIWAGNCCFAGHNRGVRNDFGKLHTLKTGAVITLTTALGSRTYAVTSVSKVSVNDTSGLTATAHDQITLYTCVEDQPACRWCVKAVEIV